MKRFVSKHRIEKIPSKTDFFWGDAVLWIFTVIQMFHVKVEICKRSPFTDLLSSQVFIGKKTFIKIRNVQAIFVDQPSFSVGERFLSNVECVRYCHLLRRCPAKVSSCRKLPSDVKYISYFQFLRYHWHPSSTFSSCRIFFNQTDE